MPTPKKTAAPKAATKKAPTKKKAPAKKKPVAKKAAPKKAAPKAATPQKVAPKPETKHRSVYLLTNSGETTLQFSDEKTFETAIKIIGSAPSKSSGSRNPKTYIVQGYGFQIVTKYVVTEH